MVVLGVVGVSLLLGVSLLMGVSFWGWESSLYIKVITVDAKISPNFRGAGVVSGVSSRIGGSERNKSVTRPRTAIYNKIEKKRRFITPM